MKTYKTPADYFSDRRHEPFRVIGQRLSPLERAIAHYVYASPINISGSAKGKPMARSYSEIYQFYFEYFKSRGERASIAGMIGQNLSTIETLAAFIGDRRQAYKEWITLEVLGKKFRSLRDKYLMEGSNLNELLYSDFYPMEYSEMTSDQNPHAKAVRGAIDSLRARSVLTLTNSKNPRIKMNPKARIALRES